MTLIRALLWDNDGVLVDTESLYFQATRELLGEAGIELRREQFVELSLRQGRSCFELAAEAGTSAAECEQLRLRRNQRYTELLGVGVAVREGIDACLRRVHARLPMAIVTGSRADHFELIHRGTGLLPYFQFALTCADYGRHKPHPEPYLTAASRLGLAPEECLVIEDSERGLESARRAGMECVAFPCDLTRGGNFASATRVVDDSEELAHALDELTARPGAGA